MPDKCLVKERKPLVPIKYLDIIFRRRRLPNTQFYFTNRHHAVPKTGEPAKKVRSFKVPKSEKLLSYIKYSDRKEKSLGLQRLKQPLHLKDNLRMAATRDLSRRLYVESPPDDIRAVVQIHPEFYTVIEGRPLRVFDDIKVYISNIRNYAMLRQQIGYRQDLILKADQNMAGETKDCHSVSHNLKQHIKNFQKFLTEDYKKACAKVAKAEKAQVDLDVKIAEFLGYVVQLTIVSNIIFKLDSIRNVLKMYRSYLLFAAPLYWREEYDETFQRHSMQLEAGEFVTHSEEFVNAENDLVQTLDIEKILEGARVELQHPYPPYLYFNTPEDMMYLFRTMELQSREYLIQLSKTQAPYKMLQYRIKKLKQSTKQELDVAQYYIDSISKEIEREQYNETYFQEKFLRILNESFWDTIASPSTLKLKICIEYVYEQIFGKCEEGHQTIRDPMKILEVTYEEYNLKLDSLDFKTVNQARKDFFSQDLKMMQDAYKAQRELREFAIISKAMNKAFLPPAQYKRPEFKKFRSKRSIMAIYFAEKRKLALASGERIKAKKFKVTPEERENLVLFTDWCDGMNPAPFLRIVDTFVKPTFAMNFGKSDIFTFLNTE